MELSDDEIAARLRRGHPRRRATRAACWRSTRRSSRRRARARSPGRAERRRLDFDMAGVALQLYTIRDECERDLEATLRAVGELGYEGVELFQLHGHDAARVRGWLDDAGLVAVGRHASAQELERAGSTGSSTSSAVLGTDRVALSWIEPSRAAVEDRRLARRGGPRRRPPLRLPQPRARGAAARRRRDVPRPPPRAAAGAPLARARPGLDLARRRRPDRRARRDERPLPARPREGLPRPGEHGRRPGRGRRRRLRAHHPGRTRGGRRVAGRRGGRGRRAALRRGRPLAQGVRRILESAA